MSDFMPSFSATLYFMTVENIDLLRFYECQISDILIDPTVKNPQIEMKVVKRETLKKEMNQGGSARERVREKKREKIGKKESTK